MNKRRAPRARKRLTCTLRHAGKHHSGVVLDLSANGLFVQTSASPDPGELLQIELGLPGHAQPIALEGRAVRRRVVPARLRAVAQGGVGIVLSHAPESYYGFVAELLREGTSAAPSATEQAPARRKPGSLERRARRLALERALGSRLGPAASAGKAPETRTEPEAKPEPEPARLRRFRVRVSLGPRKQTIVVQAESEQEARSAALAEAGEGWRVLRCEPA